MGCNGQYRPHRLHDATRREGGERVGNGGDQVLITKPSLYGCLVEN
jgi:hypothetical protein